MEKIKVDNLSFSYPKSDKLALDSVSLSIMESEFVVLSVSRDVERARF